MDKRLIEDQIAYYDHRAAKWEPAALEEKLQELVWEVRVNRTGPFYWGEGRRAG